MKQLVSEIGRGKNLDSNLSKYVIGLMSLYNRFAHVHLTMNYYGYYEVLQENDSERNKEVKELLDRLNSVIGNVILPKKCDDMLLEALKEVEDIRNIIINKMQIFTTYTDILNIYEHVLNRVEYKFKQGNLPENYSDEIFCREIMQYITAEQDNVVVNMKITQIIRQLPLRMAKGKFFELLNSGVSIYKDNDKTSLDDFLYMIRTSAMLDIPEGFKGENADLYYIYSSLKDANYADLTADEYKELHNKLLYATEYLQDIVDLYVMLTELVNDVYAILLSNPYVITDVEETNICNSIIAAVNGGFDLESYDPLSNEVMDMLIKLEGKQEKISENYMSIEFLMDDIRNDYSKQVAELGLIEMYSSLYKMSDLLSGSLFVEFSDKTLTQEVASHQYTYDKVNKLNEDLSNVFKHNNRMVNRAVMATILSELPVFFNNITELQDYIYNALSSCRNEEEKIACHEVICELMNE